MLFLVPSHSIFDGYNVYIRSITSAYIVRSREIYWIHDTGVVLDYLRVHVVHATRRAIHIDGQILTIGELVFPDRLDELESIRSI